MSTIHVSFSGILLLLFEAGLLILLEDFLAPVIGRCTVPAVVGLVVGNLVALHQLRDRLR